MYVSRPVWTRMSDCLPVCAGHRRSGAAAAHPAHRAGVHGPEARPRHQAVSPDRARQDRLLQTVRQLMAGRQRTAGPARDAGFGASWWKNSEGSGGFPAPRINAISSGRGFFKKTHKKNHD